VTTAATNYSSEERVRCREPVLFIFFAKAAKAAEVFFFAAFASLREIGAKIYLDTKCAVRAFTAYPASLLHQALPQADEA
jgi:hypothetical protein